MIWIEIIGPSGVGKSYLFKKLLLNDITLQPEFCHLKSFPFPNFIKKRVSYKKYHKALANFDLVLNSSDLITIKSFLQGLDIYSENDTVKLNLANYFYYKFRELKYVQSFMAAKDVFLSEDGIVHLNYGITAESIDGMHLPDAVISLSASEAYIKENRLKRMESGKPNFAEKYHKKEQSIEKMFSRNYLLYSMKVDILHKKLKDKFFDINVENLSTEDIVSKIEKIINECRS